MTRRVLCLGLTFMVATALAAPAEPLEALPGGAPPETLADCIRSAREGNPELARRKLNGEELRGQGWQAVATGMPSLDLSGTWSRSRDPSFLLDESFSGGGDPGTGTLSPDAQAVLDELAPIFAFPDPGDLEAQTFWRAALSADWELNPFRVTNSMSAVKVRLRQQDADLQDTDHRVVEETLRTFHEVSLHHERVEAMAAEVAAREEFLDITRRRFELELATELDTLEAAVSLANLLPESRRARTDLRNTASRLNLVMGRDPTAPLTIVPVEAIETEPVPVEEAMSLLQSRPDLVSRDLQVEFLRKRRGVERAELRPFLSASGAYGYVSRTLDDLGDTDYWRADVSLIVPLFNGFATKGRVQELNATIAIAERDLQEARRQARLEVATTLEEREAARESWEAASLTLDAAERALELTTMRFDLGQDDFVDVLNAQSQRFDARRNLIEARYDLLVQTAALKRSLGSDPTLPLSQVREPEPEADR
jgi:outer membrane protein TolC